MFAEVFCCCCLHVVAVLTAYLPGPPHEVPYYSTSGGAIFGLWFLGVATVAGVWGGALYLLRKRCGAGSLSARV